MGKYEKRVAESLPWHHSNSIMLRANFTQDQLRLAWIWASRDHACPKCNAPAYSGCKNMTDVKAYGFEAAGETKYPHTERVDYTKLQQALYKRGYR